MLKPKLRVVKIMLKMLKIDEIAAFRSCIKKIFLFTLLN